MDETMHQQEHRIVVGVDDTAAGRAALAFALQEAARGGDGVEVVTTWHPTVPTLSYPVWAAGSSGEDRAAVRGAAEQVQREALAEADVPPGVAVTARVVQGNPGPVLVDAARDARLLVVGSRALGPVRAALLGSVSRYCAQHAAGPVVVVPAAHDDTDRDSTEDAVMSAS